MMNEAIDSLMEYYYEETETEDDEETISGDEIYDSYAKWVNLLSSVIGDRKNVLTRLERTFLEIIESYSKLIMLQSELNGHLQNYCGRVVTVLKQTTDMENRLANQFREKQKKLGEILVHITKMRKFFWGDNTSATETV
ncbi:uncharacterized protein LOC143358045 isoform X1 [Halictus rubicundus]|uniref:uncharacterized protein LOC143358045 isoform X1 n=1 Tax=Halictus rubicundus TaxID=77578 RepID=UPI0040350FD5